MRRSVARCMWSIEALTRRLRGTAAGVCKRRARAIAINGSCPAHGRDLMQALWCAAALALCAHCAAPLAGVAMSPSCPPQQDKHAHVGQGAYDNGGAAHLNLFSGDREAGRHAIDDATHSCAVRLAKGRDAEVGAICVGRMGGSLALVATRRPAAGTCPPGAAPEGARTHASAVHSTYEEAVATPRADGWLGWASVDVRRQTTRDFRSVPEMQPAVARGVFATQQRKDANKRNSRLWPVLVEESVTGERLCASQACMELDRHQSAACKHLHTDAHDF